jgi:hypothetical protein
MQEPTNGKAKTFFPPQDQEVGGRTATPEDWGNISTVQTMLWSKRLDFFQEETEQKEGSQLVANTLWAMYYVRFFHLEHCQFTSVHIMTVYTFLFSENGDR